MFSKVLTRHGYSGRLGYSDVDEFLKKGDQWKISRTAIPTLAKISNLASLSALSQTHIQSVAADIQAQRPDWQLYEIEHLYLLPVECYLVTFLPDFYRAVFVRDQDDHIKQAVGWSYRSATAYEDTHPTLKGESTSEPSENPLP